MLIRLCQTLACLAVLAMPAVAQMPEQTRGAHGMALPATFTGTLPCADCPGIDHHLDLWPDEQGYTRRRSYQARDLIVDEMGRWHVDPLRNALILEGSGGARSEWQITPNDALRMLDQQGQPIESDLPYGLEAGPLAPTDLSLTVSGMVTYYADAALFTECLTGQTFPVMMEADYLPLERAYLAAQPAPSAPVLARIDAEISVQPQMEGPDRRSVVVTRFHHLTPDAGCPDRREDPDLTNVYWGLTHLDATRIAGSQIHPEAYLLLFDEAGLRYSATAGCNRLMGQVTQTEAALTFGPVASTMMACPEDLQTLEASFIDALEATRHVDLDHRTLRLLDESGVEQARFRARYTRY